MAGFYILALLGLYLCVLLAVAWRAERGARRASSSRRRPLVYALSLAVLCTSWTYFGGAGAAIRQDWSFIPNFLGPILAITVFFPVWRRIAVAAKRENVGSIADFLAGRYGKSRSLGTLVACVAMIGTLPYLALQLTSLSKAWAVVAGQPAPPAFATPLIVASLALFAILLGARRPTLTRHNRGLVRIVALESIVKLAGLLTVAGLALVLLFSGRSPAAAEHVIQTLSSGPHLDLRFLTGTLLCMVTAVTLPRQFHLGFVEMRDPAELNTARWVFPGYMLLWAAAVVPIGVAGKLFLQGWGDPDTAVLILPLRHASPIITAVVFLGGFSAGAAMVMVETVALSAMISNELVLPWAAKLRWGLGETSPDIARSIVTIRRAAIVLILLLAWLYFMTINRSRGLAELGLTSLAASAQLLPALVGAVFWRRGHANGAIAGICGGMFVWLVAVAAPQLVDPNTWPLSPSLLAIALSPDRFELGILASLALNLALFVGASLAARPKLIDRIQAATFVDQGAETPAARRQPLEGTAGDLKRLIRQFLGDEDASRAFEDFERVRRAPIREGDPVSPEIARAAERMLAGAIGASSARSVISLALAGGGREAADVGHMLDEAAQAVQFSRELLQTSLESLDQGVCVVDAEICLVAWNSRYAEIFHFDPSELYVGKPLEDLIRQTGTYSGLGPEEIEYHVNERVGPIRRRERQMFERDWADGMTLKVAGAPISSGEYITSFTDVTELKAAARALAQANELLEQRVQARTQELSAANEALAAATVVAERATNAQARFVAAASHDLLQPLHAARLFVGAAAEDLDEKEPGRALLGKADSSIDSADRLLRALLNLSKLEVGGVKPQFARVQVEDVLGTLRREFEPLARSKGLRFQILASTVWVESDPDLLRSVLQNLIGNAIRYTPPGGRVLVGCRRSRGAVRLEVRDNGEGVPPEALRSIFEEFSRGDGHRAEPGAGLGLAIAERICRALGHELRVASRVGRGSVFWIEAARCAKAPPARKQRAPQALPRHIRVLCIDDDPAVLESLMMLLERWQVDAAAAATAAEARRLEGPWDVVLADFELGGAETGLDLLMSFRGRCEGLALITANNDEQVHAAAAAMGAVVIRKPVSPASLRAFLTSAARSSAVQTT